MKSDVASNRLRLSNVTLISQTMEAQLNLYAEYN